MEMPPIDRFMPYGAYRATPIKYPKYKGPSHPGKENRCKLFRSKT